MDYGQIIMADGTVEERAFGNLIEEEQKRGFAGAPVYGDAPDQPMIPKADWKPVTMLDQFVREVIDQDGVGKCNASAGVQAVQVLRASRGFKHVNLSDDYLYARINGGQDRGSILEDALKVLRDQGTCRKETWPDLQWRLNQGPKSAAQAEQAQHRILEYFWCPTVDHVVSAVMSGWPVDTGLWWGDGDKTDGDGWLPANPPRGNRGGHAVCRTSLHNRNGQWGLGGPNSWGLRWGAKGFMVVPLGRYTREMSVGMWAVREVTALDEPLPELK